MELIWESGRQAPVAHQGRKDRGGRAHLDNSVRQGALFAMIGHARNGKLIFGQALEGKDVKELLLNVGSGGGAAAAPAAGGAAAGGAPAEEAKEEEKEEGTLHFAYPKSSAQTNTICREGRVRRGHGLRSLRLNDFFSRFPSPFCLYRGLIKRVSGQFQMHISLVGVRLVSTTVRDAARHVPLILENH